MAQVAKRYAKAILQIIQVQGLNRREYLEKFDVLEELFSIPESNKILRSPVMPSDLKLALLDYGLDQVDADGDIRDIMRYLVSQRREHQIPKIIDCLRVLIDEAEGIIRGTVTSTVELTEEEKNTLSEALGSILQKKVFLNSKIDKEILGGIVLEVGQYLVDQSLRTKLESLGQFVTTRTA